MSIQERGVMEHQALADAIASLSMTLQSLREIDATLNFSAAPIEILAAAIPSTEALPASATVAVHCLGAFEVRLNGKPLETWRAVKPRALFQYLVSHRQRPVPREALIDALWPDPDTAPAGTALKVVVHRVRKLLRQTARRLEIQATEDGYRLDGPDLWVDVEEFERLCLEARKHELEGRIDDAAASYARAVTLYRGDFLEDVPDEWVVLRRERLKDVYLLALARLTDAAFANLDYEQCIEHSQQILAHDPCREQAYRVLMLCYAHLGQRGRVRRWYEVCVRTLRGELDVDPEPDTRATYERAMAGQFSRVDAGATLLHELPTGNHHVTRIS
ncbi:MAG: winged helix-turn-helix domain-containing protein [Chloroflexi bacterium]|nr:winged helix-turn-helix domain-containing protein [Chloroflexota bacterium]